MARRVFISYAQESPEHRAVVLNLYAFLRQNGIDAEVDQIAAGQRQDWSLWMADQIREADVVLCVASEQYRLRSQGQVDEQTGRGVQWEARLIRAAFYDSQQDLQKFVPVVLPGQSAAGVPDFLAPEMTTVYTVKDFSKQGAEDLLRFLVRKPKYSATPLGDEPDFDTSAPSVTTTSGPNSIVSPQVAGMAEVIGRDQELADLRTAFTAQRNSRTPVIQVLTGMGGVGKTSLARAYAQRHLDDYEVVWWIRAEDPNTVDGEYRSLLEEAHSAAEAKLVRNAVQAANNWLSQRTKPWLLVLDNVLDTKSARGLYPAKGNGHVLVTSQDSRWPNPSVVRPVDPLGTDDAVELLATLSQDADTEAATKLAAELDGLPLALTQAASFVFSNGSDLATYLRFYQDRSAELHTEGELADDYPHTVATTWLLAIEKMSPPARLILNTIAYFAPDSIPISVLRPLVEDELVLTRAIGELLSHSLVTRGAEGTITVHRLIQAVTRHGLGDTHEHAARSRDLITAAMPERPLDLRSMAIWKQLRNHIPVVVDHVPTDPLTFDLRYLQAFLYGDMGEMNTATTLLTALVDDMSPVLGAENERVLRAQHGVAYWSSAFDVPKRRKLLTEVLEAQVRVLGPEHPDTLMTSHDLVRAHLVLEQYDCAIKLLDELLPRRVRLLGPNHRHTLETRIHQTTVLARNGQVDKAIAIAEEVIATAAAEFGAQDLQTTELQMEYARALSIAGRPAAARDLFAHIVRQHAEQRGQYDRLTLYSSVLLAILTGDAGNKRLARTMLHGTLARIRSSLGKNDPLLTKFEEALNNVQGSGSASSRRKR
ncbi:SEFIR domain-containing protein [Lentzea sp. NPDC054927]